MKQKNSYISGNSESAGPVRCPKCRSLNIYLTEHIECFTFWNPGEDEGIHEAGNYFKVTGDCRECKHEWRLRGYIQMQEELKKRLLENAILMGIIKQDKI